MGKFNASSQFSAKKALTVPIKKIPRNVKEALCIDKVYENGIFKIEPLTGAALYDQCYIFEDINYINQDDEKKTQTLLKLIKIFKAMKMQYKFTVASEQMDMDEFMEKIFRPLHAEEYPDITKGIGQFINQKIDEGTRDINRILYLTITCRAQSVEEAENFFEPLDTLLAKLFIGLGSKIYKMSADERLLVLQKILRLDDENSLTPFVTENDTSWKNQILPSYIGQDGDCMHINSKHCCILFAHDFDQTLDEEKVVYSLADTKFPTVITLDFQPVPRRLVKDKLMSSHTNNEMSIEKENVANIQRTHTSKEPSFLLSRKRRELTSLINQVDENDEEGVYLGMLVMVYAEELDELVKRVETLQGIAISNGYTLEPYNHRQLKALMTCLPIGGRQVNIMRSLLTSSAVAFQPFHSKDLQEEGGTIFGLNRTTKHLLIGNRKKLKAGHAMICGPTGSGKSHFIKETEIAQTLLFADDSVMVIDPNNEQKETINLYGGQYYDLTPQSNLYINPFQCPLDVWEGDTLVRNRFVANRKQFAGGFCEAAMKNIVVTQVHQNFISKAVRDMYADYFAQKNYNKHPTLIVFREKLIAQKNNEELSEPRREMLQDIIDSLEDFTTGVYDMFAHQSNLDINNRLIGFGLKNIPEEIWEVVMLAVMSFVDVMVEHNKEKFIASRLVVDETQVLCDRETTAKLLLHCVETYRKIGAIITLAVQNLTRVLENSDLRDMFSNCPYKVFLDQGGVDAKSLRQIVELSEDEYLSLSEGIQGFGIIVWEKQVYLLDARMDESNVLYSQFNTNFHQKAEEYHQQSQA